jgi:4-methyl-5(b-hydroxyethyl)-thiazole monophosphate biosynthesis
MRCLLILAPGFEEIEAITAIDILRRSGVEVVLAGLHGSIVEGSHKIKLITEARLEDLHPKDFDALILPGGDPGWRHLSNSSLVLDMIRKFDADRKLIGAICAAPLVLAKAGILENRTATCYPGLESELPKARDADVVVDGNIVTARGPGSALDWALTIVELLSGKSAAARLRSSLCVKV